MCISCSNGSVLVNCSLLMRRQIHQSVLEFILRQAIQADALLPGYEVTVISEGTSAEGENALVIIMRDVADSREVSP